MIKKKCLFLILIISVLTNIQAQGNPLKSATLGLKSGINFATVIENNDNNIDFRTDFYLGLAVEAMITDKFGFQIESFYSRQGFNYEDPIDSKKEAVKIDYIQVPILAKAYLVNGLNIQAGLQMGFKVNENINSNSFLNSHNTSTKSIKKFDLQLSSGIEYKFKTGFFTQIRYNYGLSEVIENSELHNSIFSLGIGYMFY
ncbi:Outer membrane protein beta-barrel domain-containing protein [Aquimarina amphilecti]|uniref:Outer membrane protein beta-barrel domain-containing protein n=1 Tax=Aquimarina amphilecti TaxID=1038014 RepID=A0A1H7UFZ1_AQUAM|nr:porin family protein [Aquimarina amphilecti]SEL95655.1 Outer membrane protein beta-barrel domain-containing protein [Aquimarina amphilecti]